MEQIGYSLVDLASSGTEIQFWGDTAGQMQGAPDVIRLSNGDDVHCPTVGADYEGSMVVERWLQAGEAGSIKFDGIKIIVTRPSPAPESVEQKLESVGLSLGDLKTALGLS